jgi:hypothetical protein
MVAEFVMLEVYVMSAVLTRVFAGRVMIPLGSVNNRLAAPDGVVFPSAKSRPRSAQ